MKCARRKADGVSPPSFLPGGTSRSVATVVSSVVWGFADTSSWWPWVTLSLHQVSVLLCISPSCCFVVPSLMYRHASIRGPRHTHSIYLHCVKVVAIFLARPTTPPSTCPQVSTSQHWIVSHT